MYFRPVGLRKISWILGTLPLFLTPSPQHLLGKLNSGCQRAAGEVKCEHWGHCEIMYHSSPEPGSHFGTCLPGAVLKGGKDRWATEKACSCLLWVGLPHLPTPLASTRVFCPVLPACFLAYSFLGGKSFAPYLWSIHWQIFKPTSDNTRGLITRGSEKLRYYKSKVYSFTNSKDTHKIFFKKIWDLKKQVEPYNRASLISI